MIHEAKKIKKSRLRKLFRPTSPPVKEEGLEINLSLMKKLVETKEQEDVLEKIKHETIPSVRDAWIEYFFKITKQPQCKGD